MTFEGISAVLGVAFASYPIVDERPDPCVASDRIAWSSVAPQKVLHTEFMVLGQVDVELQDEQVHQVFVGGPLFHNCYHFIPSIDELLQIAVCQDDIMETSHIGHVFVLIVHGKVLVRHPQYLPSSDISFVGLPLLALGLLDLLSK